LRDRSVKLVDGTGISVPDTDENQAWYPQPGTQADGVDFPLARAVLVICLSTGAAMQANLGAYSRKGIDYSPAPISFSTAGFSGLSQCHSGLTLAPLR
jgi:hypothetical protein